MADPIALPTASRPTTGGHGVGGSAPRPDGPAKTQGSFAYASDLYHPQMLWGGTLRSPHAAARIVSLDVSAAIAMAGVHAVITAEDVPGSSYFGLVTPDQPVFAAEVIRYHGEPVAAVAADHPEIAKRALAAIDVRYEPMEPLVDPMAAMTSPPIHPDGNLYRHLQVRRGEVDLTGAVSVEGEYQIGIQDQAFLGPEAGMAIPRDGGGIELLVATQDLHADRSQIAACLGIPEEDVVLTMSGVGGAFGGREDLSVQIHMGILALRTGRPVKMVYARDESFVGHVHRHPARMWLRHHATADGTLLKVEARITVDGGAYASTSPLVLGNATLFLAGPYRVPQVALDGWAVRTNNPPCGAMRGFGTVQACYGAESQMDKLAAALGMDPVELRLRNIIRPGDAFTSGQIMGDSTPARECLETVRAMPMPADAGGQSRLELPGGSGNSADSARIRRGVGYAISFKNFAFPEGAQDYSSAALRVELDGGGAAVVTVRCAAAEVGQGFVTLAQQIVREELGIGTVLVAPADTTVGSAGSSSASRQAYMSGGAIKLACQAVLAEASARARDRGTDFDAAASADDAGRRGWRSVLTEPIEVHEEFHHKPTETLDENGQGDAHLGFAFAAHRAVVDVDIDLGLVRVQQIATAQDVGRALNPLQVLGQIEGGIAQGVGLAVMEEILTENGRIVNPSFTDYLIPTAFDMPEVQAALIEVPEPDAPFGVKGAGEPPVISSTPAVVAAIRDACGRWLTAIPIRPGDIALPEGAAR